MTPEQRYRLDLVWFARGYYAGRTCVDRGEEPATVAGSGLYREGYEAGQVDFLSFDADPEEEEEICNHEWSYTGSAYGGDDDSYHGEGRVYCTKCGADGDA